MSFEKQEENLDLKKFDENFKNDLKDEAFDKKNFNDIVSGSKYDENLSKEENFKSAFMSKTSKEIDNALKNIPKEEKDKLNELQQNETKNLSTKELIENYKKIKEILGTVVAEAKKGENDTITQNQEQLDKKSQEKNNDFLSELKKSINIQREKNQEQIKLSKKQKEENMQNENKEKINPEGLLDGFPDSSKESV
ncbi:hypothetical protein H3C61_02805 [Candidatus Gracilibacteria bacterium]|nr:hypothetical protein [Candidatus Gracilibacteria bacterium]